MSSYESGGHSEITVDLVGFLANTLRGYEATSILREQLQNADDACHKQRRPGELMLQFLSDRLIVTNPSVFNDEDWRRIKRPSSRGKFTDKEQTGEFGIGFWGSLHITDSPVITSGSSEVTLHPEHGATRRDVPSIEGTRFEFKYRRRQSEIGEQLDVGIIDPDVEAQMVDVFVKQMAELLLFTRAIEAITLVFPDGTDLRASRTVRELRPGVDLLAVDVKGAPEQNCNCLVVRTEIPDPPAYRHGNVAIALPISASRRSQGQVFVTFPTETLTALNVSINAHFRATDDRRSLEKSGVHGQWNARIFEAAGRAVGSVIETLLDQDLTGVDYDTAVRWFAYDQRPPGDIGERAERFVSALDREATQRAIVPDSKGILRRSDELANLESPVEAILGQYVGETFEPGHPSDVLAVLRRWGLRRWGPHEVARWLAANAPHSPTRRSDAPPYLHSLDDALALIGYCESAVALLANVALLRDDHGDIYYAARGGIRRATSEMQHLVEGLALPLAHPRFANTALGRMTPVTDAQWLCEALRRSRDLLVGKRVPVRSIGVASEQSHVQEALTLLRRAKKPLSGLPLALDENGTLQVFEDATVCGLPQGPGRKTVAALCRRLGLTPLHPKIDDSQLEPEVQKFSLSLVLERLEHEHAWDPIEDSRLLVEAIAELRRDRELPSTLVEQLRDQKIWASSDGSTRQLGELRLPTRTRLGTPSVPVLDARLVGDIEPSALVYAAFRDLLRVDVLDRTEEFVMECEQPPVDPAARRALLEDLNDLEQFSRSQQDRLRRSAFVFCRDGNLRQPGEVLVTGDELPLTLGRRRVDEIGLERRARKRLEALGASRLPSADDLRSVAAEIAELDALLQPDPGLVLWDFLRMNYSDFSQADIVQLSDIPWLNSLPGPARRAPQDCLDPQFNFAAMLFPVPAGVGTPPTEMRDKLRIKPNLDAADFVHLGRFAAENQHSLSQRFFEVANTRATADSAFEAAIASLRDVPIIQLSDGWHQPERLVPRTESQIWRHLRELAPERFVADFGNLARAWGMSGERPVDWLVHVDVLEEISTLTAPDILDIQLARERLESLAAVELEPHQIETIRRRAVLPTSLGLRPVAEVFRGDFPPSTLRHLEPFVAIANEWDGVTPLLDALKVPGISSEIRLEPIYDDQTDDNSWREVLSVHAVNLLRFLKGSGTHLDAGLLAAWPPSVVSVRSLSVRALRGAEMLDEWPAEAHLATDNSSPTLYVSATELNHRAVVDAISSAFGIDQARKSLLLDVLRADTAAAGEAELDWATVPTLSPAEATHAHVHDETEVQFGEELTDFPIAADDGRSPAQVHELEPVHDVAGEAVERRPELGEQAPSTSPATQPAQDEGRPPYERAQSPRGMTDRELLERRGITLTYDLDDEVDEADYQPTASDEDSSERDECRVCLSYYDVLHGVLPIDGRQLMRLTTGVAIGHVLLFGEQIPARQFGPKHVRLDDGAMIFAAREVVPGTIIRLHPSSPGVVEAMLRPDPHRVDGVWMLELDDSGELVRLRQDNLDLQWETDDAFYRAERRLEDLEALMRDGGKSALQLVTEVFLNRSGEGLNADEVWGLVAISRLFAKATISSILYQQTGMFENQGGLWYKVGNELRMKRRPRSTGSPSKSRPSRAAANEVEEVLRLARRLVRLLATADHATARQVRSILDNSRLTHDE